MNAYMQLGRDDININIYTGVLSKTAESNPAHWDARPGEAAVWSAYSTLSVRVAQGPCGRMFSIY